MRTLQKLPLLPGRTQVWGRMLGIFGYCVLDINTHARGHQAWPVSLYLRDQPVLNIISPKAESSGQISTWKCLLLPRERLFLTQISSWFTCVCVIPQSCTDFTVEWRQQWRNCSNSERELGAKPSTSCRPGILEAISCSLQMPPWLKNSLFRSVLVKLPLEELLGIFNLGVISDNENAVIWLTATIRLGQKFSARSV